MLQCKWNIDERPKLRNSSNSKSKWDDDNNNEIDSSSNKNSYQGHCKRYKKGNHHKLNRGNKPQSFYKKCSIPRYKKFCY